MKTESKKAMDILEYGGFDKKDAVLMIHDKKMKKYDFSRINDFTILFSPSYDVLCQFNYLLEYIIDENSGRILFTVKPDGFFVKRDDPLLCLSKIVLKEEVDAILQIFEESG